MSRKIVFLILSSFFLAGCFAESMTLVQSGVGASQGRVLQSTISPAISLGVKKATGKFPIEHIIVKEKQRMAKKASEFENKIIESAKKKIEISKKKIEISKEKIIPIKNNIKKQATKLRWVLHIKEIKNVTEEEAFSANRPRYSYRSKEK